MASRDPKDRLKEVFRRLLRLSGGERAVIHQVAGVAESFHGTGPVGSFAATIRDLAAHNPGDPGVLAALLMNRITLHRHEAIFLAAGKLHAYLRGGGVEIMANSDNVMRRWAYPLSSSMSRSLLRWSTSGLASPISSDLSSWRLRNLALCHPARRVLALAARCRRGPIDVPGTEVGRIVLVIGGLRADGIRRLDTWLCARESRSDHRRRSGQRSRRRHGSSAPPGSAGLTGCRWRGAIGSAPVL